uniref:Aminotransferase class I/classII large domain-containing protein n=1 Tax=Salix viminalis TaxID=40686 RepID=A0A6N2KB63_SALVM
MSYPPLYYQKLQFPRLTERTPHTSQAGKHMMKILTDESSNPSSHTDGLEIKLGFVDMLEDYLGQHSEASIWGKGSPGFRENALFSRLFHWTQYLSDRQWQVSWSRSEVEEQTLTLTDSNRDLRWRTGAKIVPVHTESSNNFQVTTQALEDAYERAVAMNINVRGVLITNPSNPLGATIQRSVLEEILDFSTRKNIHLVSDESYSGSTFYSSEFTSIAEILEARGYKDSERVHIDLGLPGFRVGTIYSYNDKVVTTARRMSSFTLISSQTQHLLASMLSDKKFTESYIKTNRERLRKRYEMIVQGLRNAGIECSKGNAGLFCWMNLSPLLETRTREGEVALWKSFLHEVKLNISPGSSCHCSEPGWFRVCFANMSEETLEVALKRIHNFMEQRKTASV